MTRILKACGHLSHCKDVPDAEATSFLGAVNLHKVFIDPNEQMYDAAVEENHVFLLIITKCYCNVRLSHSTKEATVDICGDKIGNKFNKLVLFNPLKHTISLQ